ncbi:MAG: DUF637 domain-containing protein [Colwellia sp.]
MNKIMMDTSKFRVWHRVTAFFTTFFMLFSLTAPAVANTLTVNQIQNALRYAPELIGSGDDKYLYVEVPQLDTSITSGYYSAERFYADTHSTTDTHKYVGSPFAQVRMIRAQIYNLLGRKLVDSLEYQDEAAQIQGLYDNALSFKNGGYSFGQVLTQSREEADIDMIWPELRTIYGQQVIVPVLYLTQDTYLSRAVEGATAEFGGDVNFGSLNIEDVSVKFGRNSFITLAGDFNATNAQIESSGDLQLLAGGDVSLLSTHLNADGDISIGASSIELGTIVHRYDLSGKSGATYGQLTTLVSEHGDISFESRGDITVLGSLVGANEGAITFNADGSILIGGIPISSSFSGREGRWNVDRSDLTFLQSSLSAQDNIELMAKGAITLDAAELVSSQGSIKILAGLGITIIDALGQSQETASAKFGKKEIDTSVYQTVAIRSLLDAGKDIQLSTDYGDINLRSVDITSQDGTQVNAKNGGVNLLMTTETDHYSYSSVKEGMFTIETKSYGHNRETGVPNTIVGGLAVEALTGVTVEYTGDPDLTVSQQIDVLNGFEGLGWMAQLRDENNAEFLEVLNLNDTWYESDTTLSPAAIAVLTIAVAIAAGPAAGAIGTAVGGTTTVLGAAAAAGFTSIVTTASISLANGNSLESTLKSLSSKDNMRSLAVSMVTAGAISGANSAMADTAFFQADTNSINSAVEAGATTVDAVTSAATQGLTQQLVQATVNSAVSASVSVAINGGSLSDFSDAFVQSLAQKGIAEIGEYAANKIGASWDIEGQDGFDTAMKYVLHAGAGCFIGVATAENQNDQSGDDGCANGALGAVTGEFVGGLVKEHTKEEVDEAQAAINEVVDDQKDLMIALKAEGYTNSQIAEMLDGSDLQFYQSQITGLRNAGVDLARFSGGLAAMLAGADAAGVNAAADTAENAAANNALFLLAIPFLIKAIDVAITADEVWTAYSDIRDAYAVGDEEGDAKLAEIVEGAAVDSVLSKVIEKLIPGYATLEKLEIIQKIESLGQKGVDAIYDAIQNVFPKDSTFRDAFNRIHASDQANGGASDPRDYKGNASQPLSQEKFHEIKNLDNGSRPEKYLEDGQPNSEWPYSTGFEVEHLAKFENGGVRIYKPRSENGGPVTIGQDSMYIMPKDEFDSLIESSNGDSVAIEKALGLKTGQLSSGDYKIAFLNDAGTQVSIPTGNEPGANGNWLPGGFTSGGIPEATYSGSQLEDDYFTQTLSELLGE